MSLCITAPSNSDSPDSSACSTIASFGELILTPLMRSVSKKSAIRSLDAEYDLLEFLGSGAFGKVFCARSVHRSNSGFFAVKSIRKNSSLPEREHGIMRQYGCHPHLARLVEVFEDENECHIVWELCEGLDLQQHSRLPQSIDAIIEGLSLAVSHLHAMGIAHADIRAENVIVSENSIKLVDFGASIIPANNLIKTALFAADWAAVDNLRDRLNSTIWTVDKELDEDLLSTTCSSPE